MSAAEQSLGRLSGARTCLLIFAAAALGACTHQGAGTVVCDRFDYARTIGQSTRAQTLLSIVQLRYAELPTFLDVQQIVAGYNWERSGAAGVTFNSALAANGDPQGTVGFTGTFIERPTITYAPRRGAAFTRTMLTPLRPSVLLSLIEMGWPADTLFRISVSSVSGLQNTGAAGRASSAEPDFERVTVLLREIQVGGAIDVSPATLDKNSGLVRIAFRQDLADEATLQKIAELHQLLDLDPTAESLPVNFGTRSKDRGVLSIQTRSLLQVLLAMADEVDVPAAHIKSGVTRSFGADGTPSTGGGAGRLLRIRSTAGRPGNALTSVRYRGHTFWIDDEDYASKSSFAFVELLMQLTETTSTEGPPLVISTG